MFGKNNHHSFPSWYETLKNDEELKNLNLDFYDEENFKNTNENAENIFSFASSELFSVNNFIELAFDVTDLSKMIVSLNETASIINFTAPPTKEAVLYLYKIYVAPGLAIPQPGKPIAEIARLRESKPITLTNPAKKTITFYIGHGYWDAMAELENTMVFNGFLSLYFICQATAHGNDGPKSQFYTAFSASLCTISRAKVSSQDCLFYLQFEYIPVEDEYTKHYKQRFLDNKLIQQFPDDAPLDILGMLIDYNSSSIQTEEDLIEKIKEGDYNSLMFLSVMTDLTQNFEKHFMALANHPKQEFRDFIAFQANYLNNQNVLNEVLKQGISDEAKEKLKK